jgi:enamine deaminase RidA (YjgF/YER057c/UK114 family)
MARFDKAPILAATLLVAAPLYSKEPKTVIMPESAEGLAFQNAVGFSDAVIVGDTIYLSGVVAAPNEGEADLKPAFERAFARIAATLKRAGADWDDVVDMTTFHTNLQEQLVDFVPVKNKYIDAPFPAWTAIGITALYEKTAVTEIKIVARKP